MCSVLKRERIQEGGGVEGKEEGCAGEEGRHQTTKSPHPPLPSPHHSQQGRGGEGEEGRRRRGGGEGKEEEGLLGESHSPWFMESVGTHYYYR